jgi:flagellar biosynthetic protein FliQ
VDPVQVASDVGRHALQLTLLLALPMLLTGLVVGVIVSVLQAATQVQEQTLTFIPKILCMMAALFIFLPWMLTTVAGFTVQLIESMPNLLR